MRNKRRDNAKNIQMAAKDIISNPFAYRDNAHNDSLDTTNDDKLDEGRQNDDEDEVTEETQEVITNILPIQVNINDVKNVIDKHTKVIMTDPLEDVMGKMQGLKIASKPITYMQNDEQISKLQTLEIALIGTNYSAIWYCKQQIA